MTHHENFPRKNKFCKNPIIQSLKWIPVIFIIFFITWTYYTYVIQLCILTVKSIPKRATYLTIYHTILFFLLWTYWQTVLTKPGAVPSQFILPESVYDRLVHADSEEMQRQILEQFCYDLPNLNRTINGSVRYCDKCCHIKPDRAHHCSVCAQCILKMDHHCPWINNCISFTNYKYFMLFTGYSLTYALYVVGTSAQYFVAYWQGDFEGSGRFSIVLLCFIGCMFTISLISLFGYHCFLLSKNRTTLEAFSAPIFSEGYINDGYDLGRLCNVREVFGNNVKLWLLPVWTSLGNGYTFPLKKIAESEEPFLEKYP